MVWPFSPPPSPRGRARPEPFFKRAVRFMHRLLLVCFVLALLFVGSYCAWSMHRFIHHSGYFTIQETIISGGISEELDRDVRAHLDKRLYPGNDNLYLLNKTALTLGLAQLPRVRSVQVFKEYPNTLKIVLVERVPVAIAKLDDYYLIDKEGVLLDRINPGTSHQRHMPYLNGLRAEHYGVGTRLSQKWLAEVLKAICFIHEKQVMLDKMIDEWNIDNPEGVMAMLNTRTQVKFGFEKPPIDNILKLIEGLNREKDSENAKVIDLRWDKKFSYTMN